MEESGFATVSRAGLTIGYSGFFIFKPVALFQEKLLCLTG